MTVIPRLRSTLWGTAWTYLGAAASAWCLQTASASTPALTPAPMPAPEPALSLYRARVAHVHAYTQYSIQIARDKLIYQREQSQPVSHGGAQQLKAVVGIGKANARWCFRYGRTMVAHWCRCKQLKFTWYSNLIRKKLNSISGGCPCINWGVSVYQLGGVYLPLSFIKTHL